MDVAPSPNVHNHEVGELLDASVNASVSGADPDVGVPVKKAVGGTAAEVTVMYPVRVRVLLPAAFVAFRDTVYVPAVL